MNEHETLSARARRWFAVGKLQVKVMLLYLTIVSLLVTWGQFQPALFVASIKSSSTYYCGQKRCLLHHGMVYHRAKTSNTLLTEEMEKSWKFLFTKCQGPGGPRGMGDNQFFGRERERDNSTSGTTHASAQSAPAPSVGDGGGSATEGAQEDMLSPSPVIIGKRISL